MATPQTLEKNTRTSLAEKILTIFCKPKEQVLKTGETGESIMTEDPMSLLRTEYQNFEQLVQNKQVVDFGCGLGLQSAHLAEQFACQVTGIENHPAWLEKAHQLAEERKLSTDQLNFIQQVTPEHHGKYDVVISQNSMEHFPDPVAILNEMRSLLKPDGHLLITFGPPWYAPHGSHMDYFCKLPWVNVLFSEKTIMKVRQNYRQDGAERYIDVDTGLNMMSLKRFESLLVDCGLNIEYQKYTAVKRLDFLTKIPLLRELFTNHVSVSLTRKK